MKPKCPPSPSAVGEFRSVLLRDFASTLSLKERRRTNASREVRVAFIFRDGASRKSIRWKPGATSFNGAKAMHESRIESDAANERRGLPRKRRESRCANVFKEISSTSMSNVIREYNTRVWKTVGREKLFTPLRGKLGRGIC